MGFQYFISTQTLDTDFVVSTKRIKVITIHVSNTSLTQRANVGVNSADGTTALMRIVVPATDSRTIEFPESVEFPDGLMFDGETGGEVIRVSVARSRDT